MLLQQYVGNFFSSYETIKCCTLVVSRLLDGELKIIKLKLPFLKKKMEKNSLTK